MYIDGCAPDLGCSLVLRGGNEKTLINVKKIIRHLIYVAYHLKLESKFLLDEFAMPPPLDQLTPHCKLFDELTDNNEDEVQIEGVNLNTPRSGAEEDSDIENATNETESVKFKQALNRIVLSSSPFCNYPMPFLLSKDGKSCPTRHLLPEKIYWSRYLDGSVNEPSKLIEDDHEWVEAQPIDPDVIVKDPHPFTDPTVLVDCLDDEEKRAAILSDFRASGGRLDLKMYHLYEEQETRKVYGRYYDKVFETEDVTKYNEDEAGEDVPDIEQAAEAFHDPKV